VYINTHTYIYIYSPEDITRLCTLDWVAVSIEENTADSSDRRVGAWYPSYLDDNDDV
jgi:hypothetical protein